MHTFKISLIIIFVFATLAGCSLSRKVVESISGSYLDGLKVKKGNTRSGIFDYKISECFEKVLRILDNTTAEILKVDIYNYEILAFFSHSEVSHADVGFFFTEVDQAHTKVEVASLSTILTEYVADSIFKELEKPVDSEEKE